MNKLNRRRCATEINSIQLHDSFVMVPLESISLHLHYVMFHNYNSRIYQDPSMKIPSWMAIGRGKKQTLINTPSRFSCDDSIINSLKHWNNNKISGKFDLTNSVNFPQKALNTKNCSIVKYFFSQRKLME